MFSKFCRIDTNKPLSFMYICMNYVSTFTFALYILYITFMWPTAFPPSIFSLSCPSRLMEFLVSFIVPPVWLCNFSWTRNERERLTRTGDGGRLVLLGWGGGELNHITHPKKNGRREGGWWFKWGGCVFHHTKKELFMFFLIFWVFVTEFVSKKMRKIVPPPRWCVFCHPWLWDHEV